MQFEVLALRSAVWSRFVLCAWLCAACGGDDNRVVAVPDPVDAGEEPDAAKPYDNPAMNSGCAPVDVTGDIAVEHLKNFTATFQIGEPYVRTVMLFGGMPVEQPNTPSRAYIFGLDKVDAQRMAMKYPDFYLCSSVGGQEAASYIQVYDMIPATCKIHEQLVAALRVFEANAARGGDRTSLRLEGALLTVKSVTDNANGQDVSSQVSGQQFHLITKVERLTGESLLKFGTD